MSTRALLEAGTSLSASKRETIACARDDQSAVTIDLVAGSDANVAAHRSSRDRIQLAITS